MPIPESQLATWANQGSITQSSTTYNTIKNALENNRAAYAAKSFEVFLQGSYGNDTNIWSESDVDVVIRLDSIMRSDLTALPADQEQAYHRHYPKAIYTLKEFRDGVVSRLQSAFDAANVELGTKAITIKANGSRRKADVIVCHQYRKYARFTSSSDEKFTPGILFPTNLYEEIINYPKLHSENCTLKHKATSEWFKPMVRIFKNMRSKLVDDGIIPSDTAPSYFIEGMLYNVPQEKFGQSYANSFVNCINWLYATDRSLLKCANEQYLLLGNSNVQWSAEKCNLFLSELIKLWKSF